MSANDDASIRRRDDAVDDDDDMTSAPLNDDDCTDCDAPIANDESAAAQPPQPPPAVGDDTFSTSATAAAALSLSLSSSSSSSSSSNSTESETATTHRPQPFQNRRSFTLHLPDGELLDCKNTVQSHSLLHYSNNVNDDDSSKLLAAPILSLPTLGSLILPDDLEKSITVPMDRSDNNDNVSREFRTPECPVAIPLMNHDRDVATDALLSPLSSLPPPSIHYLI
jgi:hypothetical protein